MNRGQPIAELATTLQRRVMARKDFVASPQLLSTTCDLPSGDIYLTGLPNDERFVIDDYAQGQIADYTGIPRKYYDRLRNSNEELLTTNINHWLGKLESRRLVRTMENQVIAILSDKYKILDNYDLANAVLPTLSKHNCKLVSSALTQTRFYIKAVLPGMELEVKNSKTPGDIVQAGIVISNSEVGDGTLRIEPFVNRLVCTNGLIVNAAAMRRQHLGRAYDMNEEVYALLSDETKTADDKAFWLRVRDVVVSAFDRDVFQRTVSAMDEAAITPIRNDKLIEVIELTSKKLNISDGMSQDNILMHLAQGGDLSKWGLVNAITRTAEDHSDYEMSTSLERAGGTLLDYNQDQWEAIAG